MIDFEVREKDVMVKTKGDRFYIQKETLELIYEKAQEEWYYKQDVVDYLKEHYNYSLLLNEVPEEIDDLVELYAGLRKINEGCFKWEECLKQAFEEFKDPYTLEQYSLESLKFVAFIITWDTSYYNAVFKGSPTNNFQENLDVAKAGGSVAGRAREDIESQSNTPVITLQNATQLNQVLIDLLENVPTDTPTNKNN